MTVRCQAPAESAGSFLDPKQASVARPQTGTVLPSGQLGGTRDKTPKTTGVRELKTLGGAVWTVTDPRIGLSPLLAGFFQSLAKYCF